MKNQAMQARLSDEILAFLGQRRSLQLATLDAAGNPYASYAPFAIGEQCLYVLLSEIAVHAVNLQNHQRASVLIIEDEDSAEELFARRRIHYSVEAELLAYDSEPWHEGIEILRSRLGERITQLSGLSDFRLFRLVPQGGRYVKGFGRAYQIEGQTLAGEGLSHLTDGHRKRPAV